MHSDVTYVKMWEVVPLRAMKYGILILVAIGFSNWFDVNIKSSMAPKFLACTTVRMKFPTAREDLSCFTCWVYVFHCVMTNNLGGRCWRSQMLTFNLFHWLYCKSNEVGMKIKIFYENLLQIGRLYVLLFLCVGNRINDDSSIKKKLPVP